METHRLGRPTTLTPSQVRRIITWFRRREAFKRKHGSVRSLAERLRVPRRTVYNYLHPSSRPRPDAAIKAARGRPALSKAKVRRIVRWYKQRKRFLTALGSSKDLAADLGIKEQRVFDYIRRARRKPARISLDLTRKPNASSLRKRQTEEITALLCTWPRGESL